MGMIRKTMSIGTLGLVSWRSKAEKLEIAEYVLAQAQSRTEAEHAAFVGNCIALSADSVWMSAQAGAALAPAQRARLLEAGFRIETVALDAVEAAGGSLRCCIGEIF